MNEEHRFELEIRVSARGQDPVSIHREYVSKDSASTDKAAKEVFESLDPACRARMHPVNDGD